MLLNVHRGDSILFLKGEEKNDPLALVANERLEALGNGSPGTHLPVNCGKEVSLAEVPLLSPCFRVSQYLLSICYFPPHIICPIYD